ncbi:septum formation family protein [Arthrobacter sulfonylureivorans]|uniref:Septum formation family protein n=1 Tax=Arthrobacter sulfonylureivorans TaxID=2486855 RepID=A0ABY3W7V8_9MICC|nr:septum formation family protein [Arthrobacter sulfonylureivorans]UNK46410.1 septum formation family protein [Arthrobacter sulfonylureivorans]
MRIQLSAALAVLAALLLSGCSGPAASDARAAPVGTESPTAVPAAGSGSSGSASSVAPVSGRFAAPLPSGSSTGSSIEPEVALSEEESAANTAYIDSFLAEQWKAGAKPSTVSAALPGDCVFFDWEYSSGPTQTALFPVPCDEPHEGEVFGVVTHGNQPYPGEHSLSRESNRLCADFLEQHIEKLARGHSFRPFSPTEADWKAGERSSVCLYSPPGPLSERSHFTN